MRDQGKDLKEGKGLSGNGEAWALFPASETREGTEWWDYADFASFSA
jgi:hypothetical protein